MKNIWVKIEREGDDIGRESGSTDWKRTRGEEGDQNPKTKLSPSPPKKEFTKEELKELVKKVFL